MRISDDIEYLSIYFILGESPKGWTPNAIKDPPANGWSNAFVLREEGFLPRIFIPYSLQSWPVAKECYELERTREPIKAPDPVWMQDCMMRAYNSRKGMSGVAEMDLVSAGKIIGALGFEVPVEFQPEGEQATKKERKAREKVSKPNAREGLTSVAQIAEELKIEPRVARGYLRGAKVEKPEVGWAGDAAWAAQIKATIEAEMAKEKKPAPKAKSEKPKVVSKVKSKVVSKVVSKPVKKAPTPKAKTGKKLPPVILPKKKVAERVTKKPAKKKGRAR